MTKNNTLALKIYKNIGTELSKTHKKIGSAKSVLSVASYLRSAKCTELAQNWENDQKICTNLHKMA